MRKKTGIKVNVLDLSYAEKENTKFLKMVYKKNCNYVSEDLKVKIIGTWGYIKTEYGLFVLNRSGLGISHPIGHVPVPKALQMTMGCIVDDELQAQSLGPLEITLDLIKLCKVTQQMDLEDFIIRAYPENELSFKWWVDHIGNILASKKEVFEYEGPQVSEVEDNEEDEYDDEYVEDLEEEDDEEVYSEVKRVSDATLDTKMLVAKNITSKEGTLSYGKFIMNEKCDCKNKEVLFNVKEGTCSCGNSKSHSHCSKCGRVL